MTHQERTMYLRGARDILLRLQGDYDHYVIPYMPMNGKSKNPNLPQSENEFLFPVTNTKIRKMVGEALIKALIEDRRALERFIVGDYNGIAWQVVERDNKGKAKKLIINIK